MYKDETKGTWILIGTVQGTGYDCRTDSVGLFEGSPDGVWNKVSHWVNWLRTKMDEYGETACL